MKLNPMNILFGNDRNKKPPVLLAVTPPRTWERTLLGVENLLQSIAVPEPFSLEIVGHMDGVTFMARCRDEEAVKGQLTAHYPQAPHPGGARGGGPPAPGRGRAGVVHDAESRRTRVPTPTDLPGRRPPRPRAQTPSSPSWAHCRPSRRESGSLPVCCCDPWVPTGLPPTWRRPTGVRAWSPGTPPTPTPPSPSRPTG